MSVTFRNSLLWLITIVILNLSFDLINVRFDLTEDKLYTISKETKDIVNNLDDRIFIKVFLEGNLSPNYKYLQKSIFDLLKNLKEINPSRIDFEFFNPSSSEDEEIRRKEYNQLFEQGLTAINDDQNNQGISTQSTVFPGAIIYYKDKSAPVNFLKNQLLNNQSQIQISVENLEFEIISTILYLQTNSTPKIAFISGNGQLEKEEVYDITYSSKYDNMKLSYYYDIEYVNIKEFPVDSITNDFDLNMQLNRLQKYSAIIIAKPTKSFNNIDKYLIDQYIMNGGKVLWLIDGVNANMDSLINKNNFIT